MNSMQTLTTFLGWSSVLSMGLLLVTSLLLVLFRGPIARLHSRMLSLDQEDLSRAYFQYLAQFKIAILVFHVVPYCALKLCA